MFSILYVTEMSTTISDNQTKQQRKAQLIAYFEEKIEEAIAEDVWIPGTQDFWSGIRQEINERRKRNKENREM
ncbi:MAG: hypothetical protein ACRC2T_03035 [Thermoguttaceae bacterium]